jgi:predicted nucleic acid-binding protein
VTDSTTTRGLIDTNIVIHLPVLDPAQLPDEMVLSAVTLAELSAGPHHTDDPAERARRVGVLQHAEAAFDPLPFDADAARAYGRICAGVLAAGRHPRRRVADLMIAAIAVVNQVPLYTTNPADFAGLEELVTVVAVTRPPARDQGLSDDPADRLRRTQKRPAAPPAHRDRTPLSRRTGVLPDRPLSRGSLGQRSSDRP